MKLRLNVGIALLAVLGSPSVFADELVLHPNGFGEHSYCSWKAHRGLVDDSGSNADQALYFQKMTATAAFAAGVAVIQGIEGLPVSQLIGLGFYISNDSHCGAGAPRFNIRVDLGGGIRQTVFIGCQEMTASDSQTSPSGKVYTHRSVAAPTLTMLPGGTITSLAIVFDEGDDVGQGFAFLDNIEVSTTSADTPGKIWTRHRITGTTPDGCTAGPLRRSSGPDTYTTLRETVN